MEQSPCFIHLPGDNSGAALVTGNVLQSVVSGDEQTVTLTLISYTCAGITSGFTGFADDTTYTFGTNQWLFNYNDTAKGFNYAGDAAALGAGSFVTLTVVPEPSAALLGGLGLLALLRRRSS